MNKVLLLICLLFTGKTMFAQDYFTGKLTDEKGLAVNIYYDRTQLIVSNTVHQTLYKVLDTDKKNIYTIYITHNQEKGNIIISTSVAGSNTAGTNINYDKQKCGLIFSDAGNTDTVFPTEKFYGYLISFTDAGRDFPVLHKMMTADKKEISLDPLTKLRVKKHNDLVRGFYPVPQINKPFVSDNNIVVTPTDNTSKAEQIVRESSVTYPLLHDVFNTQLFMLRDSLYARQTQFIEVVTKMRSETEYELSMYMKDAHVFNDESRYGGEERNGQPHGKGILVLNSNIYSGTFTNGVFIKGMAVIKNKTSVYYGESSHDSIAGKGWLKYTNGSFLLGEFKNGKLAQGISLAKDNGEVFFGSITNNQRTGYGELKNSRGDSYYGEFMNGRLIKGYCKEVDQFGYSTYSRVENGSKATIPQQQAEAFFDTVHLIKEKAESAQ